MLRLDLCTNFLEVLGGNTNEVIDVVDALTSKISGLDIHADCHVLAGEVWLILTTSLGTNINGVLPDLNCNAILIKGANKLRCTECAVSDGQVAVGKALRHDDVENWLLKRVPVPVSIVNTTRNLKGIATVNLGFIDTANAIQNLWRTRLSNQRDTCIRSGTCVVELDVSDNVGVSTLFPRAKNAVRDVAPAVVLVSDKLVVWIPGVEKIAHWPNAIVTAKDWTKINLDRSDRGVDIKAKCGVGDEGRNARGAQNAWISSSAGTIRGGPVDWTVSHTSLVRNGNATNDSSLILVDGHLKRLRSGICGELIFDEIGTKTNVVAVILFVCPVRRMVNKCVSSDFLWVKSVKNGDGQSCLICSGSTVDVRSVVPNSFGEVLDNNVEGRTICPCTCSRNFNLRLKSWSARIRTRLIPLNSCSLVGTVIGGANNSSHSVIEAGFFNTNKLHIAWIYDLYGGLTVNFG